MATTRRDFLKIGLMLTFNSLVKNRNVFAISERLEQKVRINLPAYSLVLMNDNGKDLRETIFPIGIGKGYDGRKQTPISKGIIYEKRKRVIFRYGKNYPHLDIKKDDIIKWTNTFDEKGKPEGYSMPYSDMRGLGMIIKPSHSNIYHEDFVIHSTTDEFTIGTPASDGCIRVGMEDMLKLYNVLSPQVEKGILKKPVPIEILYDLIELNKNCVELHANIYEKDIDLIQEFKKKISGTRYNPKDFDYHKMNKSFLTADNTFNITHKHILDTLSKEYPKNFVPSYLKNRLHKTYDISYF